MEKTMMNHWLSIRKLWQQGTLGMIDIKREIALTFEIWLQNPPGCLHLNQVSMLGSR